MYTSNSELGTSTVPAFLSKLWTLVEDPDTNELICWDVSGKSFHVFDQTRFAKEILPLYFKHNNIASFIRQLNMYGFRKVITVEAANIKMEKDDLEFAHPYFIQGQEYMLEFIKRKAPNPKAVEPGGGSGGGHTSEDLSRVYSDVATMKGRQDSMTSKLEHLKIENEVLWKELVALRQRHMKQEQIVNKLIQFLVTLVGDRTLGGMKRKFPLMLQDGSAAGDVSERPAKIPRSNSTTDCASADVSTKTQQQKKTDNLEPLAIMKDSEMPSLELTDLLEDVDNTQGQMAELFPSTYEGISSAGGQNIAVSSDELILPPDLSLDGGQLATSEPAEIGISSLDDSHTNALEPITTIARADASHYGLSDFDKNEMSTQLDNLQAELDHVRDVFTTNGTYNFDPNTLFELPPHADFSYPSFPLNMLFNPDSGLLTSPKMLFSPDVAYLSTPNVLLDDDEDNELAALENSKPKNDPNGTVVGNELIQYNPPEDFSCLFEQFANGASSFGDPMNLHSQDLDELFETNQILHSPDLDHQ